MSSNQRSSHKRYAFYTTRGCSKDKIGRPVSTQISDLVPSFMTGNQCGRSSYTKFPGGPVNSRRFPGFTGGFLNSGRFPGVVDTH